MTRLAPAIVLVSGSACWFFAGCELAIGNTDAAILDLAIGALLQFSGIMVLDAERRKR